MIDLDGVKSDFLNKSQVPKEFEEYRALVETQKGKKFRTLRFDNGLEYVNQEFEGVLKTHGITRRLSAPYNPEQNGVAERRNQSLMEKARCLLLQSGLPTSFWAEAVNAPNYLHSRCPSRRLGGKTPNEIRIGKPPDVNNLRRFGSKVYVMYRNTGRSKLDARSREDIFVGYTEETKGYRVWIPGERKVIISRDVRFLDQWPASSSSKKEEDADDELEPFTLESDQPRSVSGNKEPAIDDVEEDPIDAPNNELQRVRMNPDDFDGDDFLGFDSDGRARNKMETTDRITTSTGSSINPNEKASISQITLDSCETEPIALAFMAVYSFYDTSTERMAKLNSGKRE